MKKVIMNGKSVDAAIEAGLAVIGGTKEEAKIKVISEGKTGMLGVIGNEEAVVEVAISEGKFQDARQILQDILDKMSFLTIVEGEEAGDDINLRVKGDDMGRIIGKEGATLQALEILVRTIMSRFMNESVRVSIDAGEYKDKRNKALERLAKDAAEEVLKTKKEKALPPMSAADRRIIHLALQEMRGVTTFSRGEGRDRRLVISPD